MSRKYAPLTTPSSFFANLSVNGISLAEFPPELLAVYSHAWDNYIAQPSGNGEHNQETLRQGSLVRLRRAFGALLQGNPTLAVEDASWVIDRYEGPQEVSTAHLLRAYACGATGDVQLYEQGILDWNHVISLYERARDQSSHETFCILYLERAQLHAELAHYELAVADCDRAEQSGPLTAALLSVRGLARGYLGDEKRALEDCTRSIEMEATPDGYFRRGCLLSHLGRFAEAYADFKRAHALAPDAPDIQNALHVAGLRGMWQWMDRMMEAVKQKGGDIPRDGSE